MLLKIIFKDPYDYFSLMDLKYPQIWYWREDLISLNHLFCQNIKLKYTKYKRARLNSFCKIYIGESLSMFHLSTRLTIWTLLSRCLHARAHWNHWARACKHRLKRVQIVSLAHQSRNSPHLLSSSQFCPRRFHRAIGCKWKTTTFFHFIQSSQVL